MSIPVTGAGSLFVRWGHIFGVAGDLLSLTGGNATANVATGARYPGRFTAMNADLAAGTAIPKEQAANTPYAALTSWQAQQSGLFQWVTQHTKAILRAMVNLDQGLPEDATVSDAFAFQYLLNQMYFGSAGTLAAPNQTIQSSTVAIGAQTAVYTPVGNLVIVLSGKNTQGLILQLVFPETITFQTTKDANAGGASAGNETLRYAGLAAAPGPFSQLYPTSGSGCTGSFSLVDGSQYLGATGNIANNSDFNVTTTSNTPDNWVLVTGVATTDFVAGTGTGHVYTTGGGSLGLIGNAGGTALKQKIKQNFGTTPTPTVGAGGTSVALLPDTQYAYNFWVIVPAGVPIAGVLKVDVRDGADNILNDDAGTAEGTLFDLTVGGLNVGNAWVNCHGTFRTPSNLTTQTLPFNIVLEVTTAISTGSTVYVGRMAVAKMTPLYAGGPYCAGFSGNVGTIAGLVPDQWTVATTNTYGQFALWLDKVYGTRQLQTPTGATGVQIPYASVPVIADTLIS